MMQVPHLNETAIRVVDAGSIGITVGAVVGVLPSVAALLAVIWWLIRIYETDSVQRLLGRKKD